MRLYSEERKKYIIDKLNIKSKVSVRELSEELNTSEVTIRKDLDELEQQKLLSRTFGGAVKINTLSSQLPYEERSVSNIKNKQAIAKRASFLLNDGMNIFLDAGTTTKEIIPFLLPYKDLTIITYDISLASELAKLKDIKVLILGGELEHETMCALSIDTYKILSTLRADLAFLACDAFDVDGAYSSTDIKKSLKNIMVKNAKISALLVDSSKYNKQSLSVFADFDQFDYLITDKNNKELITFKEKMKEKKLKILF